MKKPNRIFATDFGKDFNQNLYLELVEALKYHSFLYYTQDNPAVTDADYDCLYQLLQRIEKENPTWVSPNSPSQKIGGEIRKEFPSVSHEPPMMSLDNAHNFSDLQEFEKRIKKQLGQKNSSLIYHAEPKFDGIAVELMYENSFLVRGSTRGNGLVGEEITHNLKTVKNVPLQIKQDFLPHYSKEKILIRGECVMPILSFEKLNHELQAQGKKNFANPRNAAAGSLRQQDSSITAQRNLFFFPYSLANLPQEKKITSEEFENYFLRQDFLWNRFFTGLGFSVSNLETTGTLQELEKFYQEIFAKRHQLPYDLDGLVVKYNLTSTWQRLGNTAKFPRYAIAYKFPAQEAITRLNDVTFQVGRTGLITPVASLDAVNIGGVMVQRATLHNMAELERLQITLPCLVKVKRAGDVIPKIITRVQNQENNLLNDEQNLSKEIFAPKHCPSCGSLLQQEEIFIRCNNSQCKGKRLALLKFQVSRSALDIEGLGDEWIEKLFSFHKIQSLADIYGLQEKDLQGLDGMGEILSKKILNSITLRKEISFDIFLFSLGIQGIGSKSAKIIAKAFKNLESLQKAKAQELEALEDIGPILSQSLLSFFQEKENQKELENLFKNGVKILELTENLEQQIFANQTFVFTGSLEKFQRSQAEKLVEELGGKASSSVSKKTSYVVCGEKAGSKEKKAKEFGITILSEQEFIEMLPKS